MDLVAVVLRVIHIVCGVYWAGTLFFVATFLQPAVSAAGPEGGKVMQALMRRRYLDVMPAVAILTILSGLDLYRRASGNFSADWIGSRHGVILTIGSLAAIVAFVIGVLLMRPAARRVGPLVQGAQELPEGPDRDARLAEAAALRRRTAMSGRWVAGLLVVAVIGMAVARYV
ncbi:MAG: hypothetical protein GWN99_00480 [Gemmatimonadetes bacterium]|uniref:Copper resistance protein D domain-containing protein n=1 Tax=Candidatus Kutchimonas denitrificans TaxID=3056748 RepID=A0AAE4Z4W6_9BACT|nr:hypothetical protein [Candidatus Kutchimonas denitrificans]NIR99542.1 hypothetical protein [Gemmatimonadota bacterium]NIT65162.1 hypothetical protein [Gemmatimonadota bacterium]NIV23695.1 hypothetical protein [Gemmatimonadota bacterium]NIY33741.1 hypothetical protein [Gemmatimonadota bacterium]